MCIHFRKKIFHIFKEPLPSWFIAFVDFSLTCMTIYSMRLWGLLAVVHIIKLISHGGIIINFQQSVSSMLMGWFKLTIRKSVMFRTTGSLYVKAAGPAALTYRGPVMQNIDDKWCGKYPQGIPSSWRHVNGTYTHPKVTGNMGSVMFMTSVMTSMTGSWASSHVYDLYSCHVVWTKKFGLN